MPSPYPPRLHLISARRAPVSVIIRRGPSDHVCTILWDRREGTFTLGQWFKGRIYERRADLSPDGKHLIYPALNGKWQSEVGGTWTAISRAPYLKATTLIREVGTYGGGGLFVDDRSYWLNTRYGNDLLWSDALLSRDTDFQPEADSDSSTIVYYTRLLRDGWNLISQDVSRGWSDNAVFEKPLPEGWICRKLAHSEPGLRRRAACGWDEHELVGEDGTLIAKPDWEWADLLDGRLVWAEKGCLYSATMTAAGPGPALLLRDLTGMKFEAIEAPY